MKSQTKLVPPDLKRCQAFKSNGHNAFTLGGKPELIRCKNKPFVIATEVKPGNDGVIGSMTVCKECFEAFQKQLGPGYATFKAVSK